MTVDRSHRNYDGSCGRSSCTVHLVVPLGTEVLRQLPVTGEALLVLLEVWGRRWAQYRVECDLAKDAARERHNDAMAVYERECADAEEAGTPRPPKPRPPEPNMPPEPEAPKFRTTITELKGSFVVLSLLCIDPVTREVRYIETIDGDAKSAAATIEGATVVLDLKVVGVFDRERRIALGDWAGVEGLCISSAQTELRLVEGTEGTMDDEDDTQADLFADEAAL